MATTDIYSVNYFYTREQALGDGVLVDVSEMAKTMGFKLDVAVTRSLWYEFVYWAEEDSEKQTNQDTSGRLADVLSMLLFAIRKKPNSDRILYQLYVIPRDGKTQRAKLVTLKAIIAGGDCGEPVLTIMLPDED